MMEFEANQTVNSRMEEDSSFISPLGENQHIPDCKIMREHNRAVVTARYSHSGQYFATAGTDKKSNIYDCNGTYLLTVTDEKSTHGLNDVVWIGNEYIATASDDRIIRLYDFPQGKAITAIKGHTSMVYCLDINPINNCIYSGGFDGSVKIFSPYNDRIIMNFEAHGDPVLSLSVSSNGIDFATSGSDGVVRLWDSRYLKCCKFTICPTTNLLPVSHVKYSDNGSYLLCSTLDSTHRLYILDHEIPTVVKEYTGHTNVKYTVQSCFYHNENGQYIISGSEDSKIYMWDINSAKLSNVLSGHSDLVYSVASNAKNKQFVSVSEDTTVRLWSL